MLLVVLCMEICGFMKCLGSIAVGDFVYFLGMAKYGFANPNEKLFLLVRITVDFFDGFLVSILTACVGEATICSEISIFE